MSGVPSPLRFTVQEGIDAMSKSRIASLFTCLLLLLAGAAIAQRPKENVAAGRHPNLAAAQRLGQQAWQRILDAQKANEWDLAGHAQKAKELLDQANNELKMAAEASNRRK
jgi:hypothetical protein